MDSKAQEYAPFEPNRVKRLFSLLKPHLILNAHNIHIIGTNGKGSTGRFITQSLWENNHSVLHFTSPHVFDFRERFYKNNDIVSSDELMEAHSFLQQFDFMEEASYFEYATFLALVLSQSCDFLVMEAGVGGEYDSTSILKYDITIFTKIGIDHKEMLGEDIESIALTKLKAAQGEIFAHFQEKEVLDLFNRLDEICKKNICDKNGIKHINYLQKQDIHSQDIIEYAHKFSMPSFLRENLALANIVLQYLGVKLLRSRLNIRGRFEVLQDNIIVDVGHNEMAAKATLNEAKKYFKDLPFILIYNSYKDKEIEKILTIFRNHVTKIIIFVLDNPRVLEVDNMKNKLDMLGVSYEFFNPNALKLDELSKNLIKYSGSLELKGNYLVFGGFSLVENFLMWFYKKDSCTRV